MVSEIGGVPVRGGDLQFFGRLVDADDDDDADDEDSNNNASAMMTRERKIMMMLLRVKNGVPAVRKVAMRQLAERAREFGAKALFEQLLPLLRSATLDAHERHLIVKVVDRVLARLGSLVAPYVASVLVVIEPLLIDDDRFARLEGRDIIATLSKAAGLPAMVAALRPHIGSADEFVRNTTARALAVVASALGIPSLVPFLRVVCSAAGASWQTRHTGAKAVQQIALLVGSGALPHLPSLLGVVGALLGDAHAKVRAMAALAVSALADASAPFGGDAFAALREPLFGGIARQQRSGLAAFLKAAGSLLPLLRAEMAAFHARDIVATLVREFHSPSDEMKRVVLGVLRRCMATDGVDGDYLRAVVSPDFFAACWQPRVAADRRGARELVDATVAMADKATPSHVLGHLCALLKHAGSQPVRVAAMLAATRIVRAHGAADVGADLEVRLVDAVRFAFEEQQQAGSDGSNGNDDDDGASAAAAAMLDGFEALLDALSARAAPYLPSIGDMIKWRLANRSAPVRQRAAELGGRLAPTMARCGAVELLGSLSNALYENLREEYPTVLGAILAALTALLTAAARAGIDDDVAIRPGVGELLPALTPILRNRHERVQEPLIVLIGAVAERGASQVSAREWMRICFELLELLNAGKQRVRRAAVATFGHIAAAIGPQDVLAALLGNLKVQERQVRVCTTVAIAIVARACEPFTVVPALMNEYRVPDRNVRNGVLKALSFTFEYVGPLGRDYVYSVAPLLQHALQDADLVLRQTACTVVKHIALGLRGLGCQDVLLDLLNHVWPNIFETSPHVINAVLECLDALRLVLGAVVLFQYVARGLFHPARRVRRIYWYVYNQLYVAAQHELVPALAALQLGTNASIVRRQRNATDHRHGGIESQSIESIQFL
jgi:splicing factor 3B subunit 1